MTAADPAPRGLVLVVEDDRAIAELERLYLRREGFGVHVESDGQAALDAVSRLNPVAVVLDVGLPGLDGVEVCRRLRAADDWTPVVFVTARDDEVDRIVGLELGADDYVTKPFSPRELVARVRAVLRRSGAAATGGDDPFLVGDVTVDPGRRTVTVAGRAVDLTATEFDLVAHMARQPGRVFTRAQLLDVIHGIAVESYDRAIDAHVKNIRRKLEPEPHSPRYLLTVHGVGYRFAQVGGEPPSSTG